MLGGEYHKGRDHLAMFIVASVQWFIHSGWHSLNKWMELLRIFGFLCLCTLLLFLLFRHSVLSDSCDPMDCSPPDSFVHGIFQARILEWVAISFSQASSWPRDRICVFCIGRWILYCWATWEARLCTSCFLITYNTLFPFLWLVGPSLSLKPFRPFPICSRLKYLRLPMILGHLEHARFFCGAADSWGLSTTGRQRIACIHHLTLRA